MGWWPRGVKWRLPAVGAAKIRWGRPPPAAEQGRRRDGAQTMKAHGAVPREKEVVPRHPGGDAAPPAQSLVGLDNITAALPREAAVPSLVATVTITLTPTTWVVRLLLSHPEARLIGCVPYSTYLVHWQFVAINTLRPAPGGAEGRVGEGGAPDGRRCPYRRPYRLPVPRRRVPAAKAVGGRKATG